MPIECFFWSLTRPFFNFRNACVLLSASIAKFMNVTDVCKLSEPWWKAQRKGMEAQSFCFNDRRAVLCSGKGNVLWLFLLRDIQHVEHASFVEVFSCIGLQGSVSNVEWGCIEGKESFPEGFSSWAKKVCLYQEVPDLRIVPPVAMDAGAALWKVFVLWGEAAAVLLTFQYASKRLETNTSFLLLHVR